MAKERSKVVNRRPLQDSSKTPEGAQPRLFKRGNMLRITGEDGNGMEISASTV